MPHRYSSGRRINKAKTKKEKSRKQKKIRSSRKMRKSRKNKYYSQNQEGGGWWPSLFRRSSPILPYYQDESGHAEPLDELPIFTPEQQYKSTIRRNRQEIQEIITSNGTKPFVRFLQSENFDYGIYMGSNEPMATLLHDLIEEDEKTSEALKTIKHYSDLYRTIEVSKLIYGGSLA